MSTELAEAAYPYM